jgi:hypothetical protein
MFVLPTVGNVCMQPSTDPGISHINNKDLSTGEAIWKINLT